MQFHRSQLDERRRRVLTDEVLSSTPTTTRDGGSRAARSASHQGGRRGARYGKAEFIDAGPRITDLVPGRYSIFALLFLLGVTIVAALEVAYTWMPQLAPLTTDGRVAAFDLDGEGSLAVWFSSVVLGLSALIAVLIFGLRRHKEDDYQGRYRIWIWAALCWLLMSIDETGSLHEGFKELMVRATGWRIAGDGSLWWVFAYGLVLGVVGVRLLLEMRPCRASTTAIILAAGCYVAAVVTQLGWIMGQSGARGVMVEEGCEMMGNLLLLLGMGLHARFVILQSQGLLTPRPTWQGIRRKKKKPATGQARPSSRGRKHAQKAATSQRSLAARHASQKGHAGSAEPSEGDDEPLAKHGSLDTLRVDGAHSAHKKRKLSKAERKALRKQKRREQEMREM